MDDVIYRQAAIDALGDEPEVWTGKDEYAQGLNNQWHYDRNALKAVPSAQPESITCIDCKHRYVDGENVRFNVCELNHNKVQSDDWFCADAERRTDER